MLSPIIPGRRVAPEHNSYRARANWQRLGNMARTQAKFGTTTPGAGRLGLAGTRGGKTDSLTKYMKALEGAADFPFRWRIADTELSRDFADLIDGRPVTARSVVQSERDLEPVLSVPFVMLQRREVFIGPPLRIGGTMTVNHAHLARLASSVIFAGQMTFGRAAPNKHVLLEWNADSGGYRSIDTQAPRTGLPMQKYRTL
ncbi:MAG TPA: hypothetical protein VF647_04115 [Longimicrobium sp.]|jgi:hypothetical protein